ncbi:TPM domain-containing protein [Psychrobacter sp.]|uniref:TPM domain-containing protein n=1 Tax=Psychrobacter sp. TaxID=56811 RepID=UPI003BB05477
MMKLHNKWFKFGQSLVLITFFMTHLSLSGCSGVNDSTQSSEDANSQALNLAESENVLPLVKDRSESDYIAPEMLVEKLDSPVNDFTSTLSDAEIEFLNKKLLDIYDEGLLQIGVAIVATTDNMPIFDYAMAVAKEWKLGSPENNNGLLILVALNDKNIYILTGLDVESSLTDERVARIIKEDITPHFRNAHYITGLSTGIDSLAMDMRKHQTTK